MDVRWSGSAGGIGIARSGRRRVQILVTCLRLRLLLDVLLGGDDRGLGRRGSVRGPGADALAVADEDELERESDAARA